MDYDFQVGVSSSLQQEIGKRKLTSVYPTLFGIQTHVIILFREILIHVSILTGEAKLAFYTLQIQGAPLRFKLAKSTLSHLLDSVF